MGNSGVLGSSGADVEGVSGEGVSKSARRRQAKRRARAVAAVDAPVGAAAESAPAEEAGCDLRAALRESNLMVLHLGAQMSRLEEVVNAQADVIQQLQLQCGMSADAPLESDAGEDSVCVDRTLEERVESLESIIMVQQLDSWYNREVHMIRRLVRLHKALNVCLNALGLPRMADEGSVSSTFKNEKFDVYDEKEDVMEFEIGHSTLECEIQDINSRLYDIESELQGLANH